MTTYILAQMSALLLKLSGDATVRGTVNSDGDQVFSVFNFINFVCNKRGTYGNKVWERLTSEDSVFKKELDELYTEEYVNGLLVENDQLSGLIVENDQLSRANKTRRR